MSLLENSIIKLISNSEYYGHLINMMNKKITASVPTAGVAIQNGEIFLYINEKFWNRLSVNQQTAVLKHECGHLVLHHIDRMPSKDEVELRLYNIAADIAIHEIVAPEMKEYFSDGDIKAWTVEFLRETLDNPKIESNQTAEYYFHFLKQKKDEYLPMIEKMLENLKKNGQEMFEDSMEELEKEDSDVIKNILLEHLLKCQQKTSIGSTPGEALLAIDKIRKSKINWRSAFRRIVTSSFSYDKSFTRSRTNRRFGIKQPGKRCDKVPHIVNIVDTSGSMSKESLDQLFAEEAKMHKLGYKVTVIESDCEVKNIYEFDPKKFSGFTGRGGTAYHPGIDAALKLNPDIIVYYGDGDCADIPEKPKCPFLWVMVDKQKPPVSWGKIINIPI